MEKIHTIIIQGGLGNQLFQIFTLINYCLENSCNYIFPKNMQIWDKYRYPYWDSFFIELKKNVILNDNLNSFTEFEEPNFHYNKIPIFSNNTKLNGYFQSDLYFKNNFKKICNILNITDKQDNIKKNYINIENTISLHFRMGDYVKGNQQILPVINNQYYINALKYIINKTGFKKFNILYACEQGDDNMVIQRINDIKKNLTEELNFIKISNELLDWEQLLLMSVCNHNIIANSTFSWWSAYLNNNKEKIVCYPSIWFGSAKNNINLKDLHPQEWIKI